MVVSELFPAKNLNTRVEDILTLYNASLMARMTDYFTCPTDWSGAAETAAFQLGKDFGLKAQDARFGISDLDKALDRGIKQHIQHAAAMQYGANAMMRA